MVIDKIKRDLMKQAQEWCDEHDKSTEFMLQYMQDTAKASFDEVMEFLTTQKNNKVCA